MDTVIVERAKRARTSTSSTETDQRQKLRREENRSMDSIGATALPPRSSTPLKATGEILDSGSISTTSYGG